MNWSPLIEITSDSSRRANCNSWSIFWWLFWCGCARRSEIILEIFWQKWGTKNSRAISGWTATQLLHIDAKIVPATQGSKIRSWKYQAQWGFEYNSNHLNTGLIWNLNGRFVSGCQIEMVVWKPNWKKPVDGPKCLVFEWSAKSGDLSIWIPYTHTVRYSGVRYSDGYCTILVWYLKS